MLIRDADCSIIRMLVELDWQALGMDLTGIISLDL